MFEKDMLIEIQTTVDIRLSAHFERKEEMRT